MRFNFDHIVYSYYNNKLLTTLEKIYTPRIQEGPLILYDARHVHELTSLICSEDSNHASMLLTYSREDRIPDWSMGYLLLVLQTVAGKAVLSSILHALCRYDHTNSTQRSDSNHDTDSDSGTTTTTTRTITGSTAMIEKMNGSSVDSYSSRHDDR